VRGPLHGLRIVDLTRALSGPYCTMLLADLGATVVKVEPLGGDMMRGIGPFAPDDEMHAFGGYFQSVNRNKSSVAVNLRDPRGVEIVKRLASRSSVLVENYRPRVMEGLGLSYETLHALNPRIVYGCIRGFGDPRTGESPYADWPAFDVIAQAMGGLIGITGPDPETPLKVGPGVGDIFPAALLAVGILAALRHADATGEGQLVDVAMYDGILALCERIVYQYSYSGEIPKPVGNTNPIFSPFGLFESSDGSVAIAAPRDAQWRELCSIMGREELGTDERFATNSSRLQHDRAVRDLINSWTSVRSKRDVMEDLGGRVPCGPVQTAADIFADPHIAARHMLMEVPQPGSSRPAIVAGSPIRFTANTLAQAQRAPLLGEHTAAILDALGYSAQEVTELRGDGVVAQSENTPLHAGTQHEVDASVVA
jgi:crotonobetainyl-CoA:carnitine CoA-transferase CaiB-like acyl-CoA transferase